MKRDMELVRQILLTIEAQPSGYAPHDLHIDDYSEEQVGYHVLLMVEGDLLKGEEVSTLGGQSPVAIATRMTWKGHEFLDAAREPAVWDRAKTLVARAGGSSFPVVMEALARVAIDRLG